MIIKRRKMEKGIASKATQDALMLLLMKAVEDQKPPVKLAVSLGGKLAIMLADDVFAEKLPEELKVKARAFLDAIFVEKDWDKAILLGVDLAPIIYDLFKK